jgi:hypothetical protein
MELLTAFQDFLAQWEDPDPGRAALNGGILALEASIFLENPQMLAIRAEPPEPGFPQAMIGKLGGVASILARLSKGPLDWRSLAEKYKYDIIQCLNLSLEVNGRAPVAVYLPPAGAEAPLEGEPAAF